MQDYQTNQAGQLQKALPCINKETLDELTRRGLLHLDGSTWRFGDDSNGTTRRLDGRAFRLGTGKAKALTDNSGEAWHRLIGLDDVIQDDRRYVLLAIEGSKDALAAADFAYCIGALPETGVMCALGSGYRPLPPEMHKLAGRFVGLIGDNDVAGIETTQRVSYALYQAGVEHEVWDWRKCEIRAKDSFAFWAKAKESGEVTTAFVKLYSGTFFPPSVPSYNSPIQPFNPSTHTSGDVIGITIEQFVAPYIVTQKGTGNSRSFDLARAIQTTNPDMTMNEISLIHDAWFGKSLPYLPKDADRDASYRTFLTQLTRVRFTETSLRSAIERARKKPPFIPALDGNDEATMLASLCRELQREAGERSFICPVNIVQRAMNLRWPEEANRLLHQLERLRVIQCVDRGAPNTKGKKGKSTYWRYKLPMDQ